MNKLLDDFYLKSQSYPYRFTYGDIYKLLRVYENKYGLFVVHEYPDKKIEVFWAVRKLEDLHDGMEIIKQDFSSFFFCYGNSYSDLLKQISLITSWGYKFEYLLIGFRLDLSDYNHNSIYDNISSSTLEILPKIFALISNIFDVFNPSYEELTTMLSSANYRIYHVNEDHDTVGFIIVGYEGKSCFIRNIGVHHEHRRKGYGKALINHALQEARNEGVKLCFLWVEYNNKPAITLYQSIGFKQDLNEAEAMFSFNLNE